LAALVPNEAHVVQDDGSLVDIPVSELSEGQRVLIRPGEQVPIDGEVVEGRSSVNESFLTGESKPVSKEPGDEVVAGGINGEGTLTVAVTRTGDETTMSQIMRLVEDAQQSRSEYAVLADRAAMWLTIIAIGIALPTFLIWLGLDDVTFAVTRAVTVLVIACPHALGLAVPLVNVNATGISAQNGILVRNVEAFERGRDIVFVAFDKTGTLTEGRFVVSDVAVDGVDRDRALALAAGLERGSEHPLAAAIVEAAESAGVGVADAGHSTAVPGQGIEATIDGRLFRIGRPEWAEELDVVVADGVRAALEGADHRGESAVVLMDEQRALAVLSMADKIRDEARGTVDELHELGVTVVMITGDAEAVASTVASTIGIDRYYARVLPQDKARIVKELQEEGPTAFVGDGINDAPALLTADLGIAIGAGTNVAIESADLVLVESDPADVARTLTLSKATQRKVRQNLVWATGYNAIAIPVAAGVLISFGILLSPALGALFMSLSTVIVAINAMLLRRVDLSVG
jgi:Cu2+-exporting ATPase